MALKKTVKKRRRAKRKVISMETITEALQAEISLSSFNQRALARLSSAVKAVERQDSSVETSSERVTKARAAVANAKTPASKEKAKERLAVAQSKLKEVKAARASAVSEQRKAERLAKGLYTAMQKSQAKMVKEFEKSAKSLEKAANKTTRRRRRSKKKAVATA
jgi:ribosomal protein S12 methylthiotransferase accessory factor YcaO